MRSSTTPAFAMAIVFWTASIAAAGEVPPFVCGDVNDTGSITASDALFVLKKGVGQDLELSCGLCDSTIASCESALSGCSSERALLETSLATCSSERTQFQTNQELLQTALRASLRFQSTVTAVFDQGALPAGVSMNDTVIFALSPDFSTAPPGVASSSGCSYLSLLCEAFAWTFPSPVPYVVSYSSGYVETGEIDRIEILDGGYKLDGEEKDFQEDRLRFGKNGAVGFDVINDDGAWHDNDLSGSLVDAMSTVATPRIFNLSFLFNVGRYTTYNYDYARPQKHTFVTMMP